MEEEEPSEPCDNHCLESVWWGSVLIAKLVYIYVWTPICTLIVST